MSRPRAVASAVALAVVVASSSALACAVCAAGDPTLEAMGSEKSFEGRVRAALAYRIGEAWTGERGVDAILVDEQRLDLQAVYAPWRDVAFSLDMPLLYRRIGADHAGHVDYVAPGDLEARARYTAWTSSGAGVRQALAFHAGIKAPTAPLERDPMGELLPPDLEAGCSSITPLGGASYVLSSSPLTFVAAATVYFPFPVRSDAPHSGDSLRTQTSLQVQPRYWIAGRLGFDTKLEEPGTLPPNDAVAPNSGGFVGYVASEIEIVPRADWLVTAGGFFPVIQALRGHHGEGPVLSITVALDF
ncbi:MAG TPA: hypothetical protein VGM56_19030 [Byssovorax sp.]|jgi:hypothetical protein